MRASWWRRPGLRIAALAGVAVALALWQALEPWLFPGPLIVSGRVLDGRSIIDGDTIVIDPRKRTLDLELPDAEIAKRMATCKPSEASVRPGSVHHKYVRLVSSAHHGCVV